MGSFRFLGWSLLVGAAYLGRAEAGYLTPADIDALPSAPADVRIAYASGPEEFSDLRLPAGSGPYPVAIIIHGGCWVSRYAAVRNTSALADALRRQGVATYNIEYRCIDQPGGGWPGTFLDVAKATDDLRTIATRYRLDLTRVIAMGHSAGGQLALWLAGRHRLPRSSVLYQADPLKLVGVLAYGAIGDLKQFESQELEICGGPVVTSLLGGTPAERPMRYAQASPRELLPLGVPLILINGVDDDVVPPAVARRFVAAAIAAGDRAKLVVVEDASHHEYNAPSSPAWPAMRDSVWQLLRLPAPRTN